LAGNYRISQVTPRGVDAPASHDDDAGGNKKGEPMPDNRDDEGYFHYHTPMWQHLLWLIAAVALASMVCQLFR
jgi:hypothetical protein